MIQDAWYDYREGYSIHAVVILIEYVSSLVFWLWVLQKRCAHFDTACYIQITIDVTKIIWITKWFSMNAKK